ncbi:MAG: hypothetical protein U5K69_01155 [Balneolaceae bacterium]|nr:hypothetical protein [Balneolaceae bacterium]
MQNISPTYRLIATLMALLVLGGVSSPTSVYAWGGHCDMEMEASASGSAGHSSDMMHHHSEQQNEATRNAEADCATGITCDCCASQSVIKTRSANTFNRVKADLSVIAIKLDPAAPNPK